MSRALELLSGCGSRAAANGTEAREASAKLPLPGYVGPAVTHTAMWPLFPFGRQPVGRGPPPSSVSQLPSRPLLVCFGASVRCLGEASTAVMHALGARRALEGVWVRRRDTHTR